MSGYIIQEKSMLGGWLNAQICDSLEEAINTINRETYNPSKYQIVKLVATFEEKYETKIHGEGD